MDLRAPAYAAIWLACQVFLAQAQSVPDTAISAPTVPAAAAPAVAEDVQRAQCNPPTPRAKPLSDDDAAACRVLFQHDVAAARARQEAFQQKALADLAASKAHRGGEAQGPVPLSSFVGDATLAFGDIVVSDEGPRVYVGRSYELATLADFVRLDAARSPHRKRAADLLKAYRQ